MDQKTKDYYSGLSGYSTGTTWGMLGYDLYKQQQRLREEEKKRRGY